MKGTCLPRESLRFLADLAAHNNREWFAAERDRLENDLMRPAKILVEHFCEAFASTFPHLVGSTASAGGSLTRLHRDVRFSSDKRPFHTHIGMHFWHRQGRKMETPGFFLRVSPTELLLATGLHQPEPKILQQVRQAIDQDQKAWRRATQDDAFLRAWNRIEGESLKRVPPPWSAAHPWADDLRRKDFTAFIRLPVVEVTKRSFAKFALSCWETSTPLMAFLCRAMNLKF